MAKNNQREVQEIFDKGSRDRAEPIFGAPGNNHIEDPLRPIPKFLTNAANTDAPSSHSDAVRKGLLSELESELSKGVKEVNVQVREIRQHNQEVRSANWDREGDPVHSIAKLVLDMNYTDFKRMAEALATTAEQKGPQDYVGWIDVLHRWALGEYEGAVNHQT